MAVLTLTAWPLIAMGQGTVKVTATADPPSPQWTGWGQPTQIGVHATAVAPDPDTGSTLQGPIWSWSVIKVEYSNDNINWTTGGASYTEFVNGNTADDTLKAWFYQGAYWRITCQATVGYSETPGAKTWTGSGTCQTKPNCAELVKLTVTGATTKNVLQVNDYPNYAAVLQYLGTVNIKATVAPNDPNAANLIQWTGGNAVMGDNSQRSVDKGTSASTTVTATVGVAPTQGVNIWIIWGNVTIDIAGTIAKDNNASSLVGQNWQAAQGGGNAMGAIDHDTVPGLTYAYTIGKIQATGKLTPPGIGKVISTTAWKFKRTKESVAWDNGGHYTKTSDPTTWAAGPSVNNPAGTDDTGAAPFNDLDPNSGGSVDTIYDVDYPGCSCVLDGITIYRTSEYYGNFTQFVTVTLDVPDTVCSNNGIWSYTAQVDGDKPAGKRIDLNKLDTNHIDVATRKTNGPNYPMRK
jgi:hypothetical protein